MMMMANPRIHPIHAMIHNIASHHHLHHLLHYYYYPVLLIPAVVLLALPRIIIDHVDVRIGRVLVEVPTMMMRMYYYRQIMVSPAEPTVS